MMISTTQLAEASIDEAGDIVGRQKGDQTGYEIHTRGYYSYPWNCVLRYPEAAKPAVKPAAKPTEKVLDKKGYKKGQKTIGVLALKQLIILAKAKELITQDVNNDNVFGNGTKKAVNLLLKKWGYKQTGVAGANFIKRLGEELRK